MVIVSGLLFSGCTKNISGSGKIVKEERPVQIFSGIDLDAPFEIILERSPNYSVVLEGEDNILPRIEIRVVNGILKIGYRQSGKAPEHLLVRIKITMPALHQILIGRGGSAISNSTWESPDLFFQVNGKSKLSVHIRSLNLRAIVAGSAELNLSGTCSQASYTISGSARLLAFPLASREVQGTITGWGLCHLSVTDQLKASIDGNGTIIYRGAPAALDVIVSGKGKISREII